MVKVTPLVKHKQIKKRTATFFRMHSNRFMRVPVRRRVWCWPRLLRPQLYHNV